MENSDDSEVAVLLTMETPIEYIERIAREYALDMPTSDEECACACDGTGAMDCTCSTAADGGACACDRTRHVCKNDEGLTVEEVRVAASDAARMPFTDPLDDYVHLPPLVSGASLGDDDDDPDWLMFDDTIDASDVKVLSEGSADNTSDMPALAESDDEGDDGASDLPALVGPSKDGSPYWTSTTGALVNTEEVLLARVHAHHAERRAKEAAAAVYREKFLGVPSTKTPSPVALTRISPTAAPDFTRFVHAAAVQSRPGDSRDTVPAKARRRHRARVGSASSVASTEQKKDAPKRVPDHGKYFRAPPPVPERVAGSGPSSDVAPAVRRNPVPDHGRFFRAPPAPEPAPEVDHATSAVPDTAVRKALSVDTEARRRRAPKTVTTTTTTSPAHEAAMKQFASPPPRPLVNRPQVRLAANTPSSLRTFVPHWSPPPIDVKGTNKAKRMPLGNANLLAERKYQSGDKGASAVSKPSDVSPDRVAIVDKRAPAAKKPTEATTQATSAQDVVDSVKRAMRSATATAEQAPAGPVPRKVPTELGVPMSRNVTINEVVAAVQRAARRTASHAVQTAAATATSSSRAPTNPAAVSRKSHWQEDSGADELADSDSGNRDSTAKAPPLTSHWRRGEDDDETFDSRLGSLYSEVEYDENGIPLDGLFSSAKKAIAKYAAKRKAKKEAKKASNMSLDAGYPPSLYDNSDTESETAPLTSHWKEADDDEDEVFDSRLASRYNTADEPLTSHWKEADDDEDETFDSRLGSPYNEVEYDEDGIPLDGLFSSAKKALAKHKAKRKAKKEAKEARKMTLDAGYPPSLYDNSDTESETAPYVNHWQEHSDEDEMPDSRLGNRYETVDAPLASRWSNDEDDEDETFDSRLGNRYSADDVHDYGMEYETEYDENGIPLDGLFSSAKKAVAKYVAKKKAKKEAKKEASMKLDGGHPESLRDHPSPPAEAYAEYDDDDDYNEIDPPPLTMDSRITDAVKNLLGDRKRKNIDKKKAAKEDEIAALEAQLAQKNEQVKRLDSESAKSAQKKADRKAKKEERKAEKTKKKATAASMKVSDAYPGATLDVAAANPVDPAVSPPAVPSAAVAVHSIPLAASAPTAIARVALPATVEPVATVPPAVSTASATLGATPVEESLVRTLTDIIGTRTTHSVDMSGRASMLTSTMHLEANVALSNALLYVRRAVEDSSPMNLGAIMTQPMNNKKFAALPESLSDAFHVSLDEYVGELHMRTAQRARGSVETGDAFAANEGRRLGKLLVASVSGHTERMRLASVLTDALRTTQVRTTHNMADANRRIDAFWSAPDEIAQKKSLAAFM